MYDYTFYFLTFKILLKIRLAIDFSFSQIYLIYNSSIKFLHRIKILDNKILNDI
jgi:hypothetical protein